MPKVSYSVDLIHDTCKNNSQEDAYETCKKMYCDMCLFDEVFATQMVAGLEEINFEIYWETPWYQNSTILSRKYKEFPDESNKDYRTGDLTPEEITLIEANWEEFVKKYDIPNYPQSFARWKERPMESKAYVEQVHKARVFATTYCAKGVNRQLSDVFEYFKSKYAFPVKGSYSAEESDIMKIMHAVGRNDNYKPSSIAIMLSYLLKRDTQGISLSLLRLSCDLMTTGRERSHSESSSHSSTSTSDGNVSRGYEPDGVTSDCVTPHDATSDGGISDNNTTDNATFEGYTPDEIARYIISTASYSEHFLPYRNLEFWFPDSTELYTISCSSTPTSFNTMTDSDHSVH